MCRTADLDPVTCSCIMYRSVLALVCLVAMATRALACSPDLTDAEFRQMYCAADLVFRGYPTWGSSGMGVTENGNMAVFGGWVFFANQTYKGSPPDQNSISIERQWTANDNCTSVGFPDQADQYLVFGQSGDPDNSYYSVQPCRHSFPWTACVPDSFTADLPNIQC